MYLLDTNVVSELRLLSRGRGDQNVASWARSIPAITMYLSAITVEEIERGIVLAERSDPRKGSALRSWFEETVLPSFADRTLVVDVAVARRAARLQVPDPISYPDALIGATAIEHGFTLVTRNTKHFRRFAGLSLLDPWD